MEKGVSLENLVDQVMMVYPDPRDHPDPRG